MTLSTDISQFIIRDSLHDRVRNLLRAIRFSHEFIDGLSLGDNGEIYDEFYGRVVGDFKVVDDGLPVVGFHANMRTGYNMSQRMVEGAPRFFPVIYDRVDVGIQAHGKNAPPELAAWLLKSLFDQVEPDSYLHQMIQEAKPFLQYEPHTEQLYLAFRGNKSIYPLVRWINENYPHTENLQ